MNLNADVENAADEDAVKCRLCLENGFHDVCENSFLCNGEEVSMFEAFMYFSKCALYPTANDMPTMLCAKCADNLVIAYEFAMKVKLSDERYLSDKCIETANSNEELFVEADDDVAENIFGTEDVEFEFMENLESDDIISMNEMSNVSEESQQLDMQSNDMIEEIYETDEEVEEAECYETTDDILTNLKRKQSDSIDGPSAKRANKTFNPLDTDKFICVPQYIISSQTVIRENEDGTIMDNIDANSPKTIKTVDVSAVRVNSSNIDFDTDLPDYSDDVDNTAMYMCKYCPKAFSTPHHLISHTRKSHICQFCLEGFNKISDLHLHIRDKHSAQFDCPLCVKVFSCNSNLRAHVRKMHNVNLPQNVSLLAICK